MKFFGLDIKAHDLLYHYRELDRALTEDDSVELLELLKDDRGKWFAGRILGVLPAFAELFVVPMIRAAVYERDISYQGVFIEPVVDLLIGYIRNGSSREKCGAANAFYHAREIEYKWHGRYYEFDRSRAMEETSTESNIRILYFPQREDIRIKGYEARLMEVMENDNPIVQYYLRSRLPEKLEDYPPGVRDLAAEAFDCMKNLPTRPKELYEFVRGKQEFEHLLFEELGLQR